MDNDMPFAALLFAVVLALAGIGLGSLFLSTQDKTIISSCEKNGYWQTGQTRVICYVEEKNE